MTYCVLSILHYNMLLNLSAPVKNHTHPHFANMHSVGAKYAEIFSNNFGSDYFQLDEEVMILLITKTLHCIIIKNIALKCILWQTF